MYLYFIVFIILALLALISHGKNRRDQQVFGFISAFIIVCFQGLRWRTGTDWEPYLDCFVMSDKYQVEYVEWGYYIINRIIKSFTDSYTVFLLIQCSVIVVCNIKTAKYFNVYNTSLVLFYVFACCPFPIRYTMAVSIFLMAYRYIVEHDYKKFFIIFIIAVMCHQLVIFTLPFYFICQRNFSGRFYFIIYIVCCSIGLMSELIFSSLLDGVEAVFNYLPEFSQRKAEAYFVDTEDERSVLSTILSFFNGALFVFIFSKIKEKYFASESKYVVLLNLYVFGLCLGRIVIGAVPYLSRLSACFAGGFILMLYHAICSYQCSNHLHRNIIQFFLLVMFIVYSFVIYNTYIVKFEPVLVPYYSIFSTIDRTFVY